MRSRLVVPFATVSGVARTQPQAVPDRPVHTRGMALDHTDCNRRHPTVPDALEGQGFSSRLRHFTADHELVVVSTPRGDIAYHSQTSTSVGNDVSVVAAPT